MSTNPTQFITDSKLVTQVLTPRMVPLDCLAYKWAVVIALIRQSRTSWRSTMHLISRISNKCGGSQHNSCLKFARAVAHGRMTYGFPVYQFKSRKIQELGILNRTLIQAVTRLPGMQEQAPLSKLSLTHLSLTWSKKHNSDFWTIGQTPQGRWPFKGGIF